MSHDSQNEPAGCRTNDLSLSYAAKLSLLPTGWEWTTLGMIAELKGGITKGQKRSPGTILRSVPYLRVANVQRGYLDLSDMKTIEATDAEIDELRLVPGDILFNEGGDRDKLGRGWVWRGEVLDCIHQNHVFRARLRITDSNPKFFSHYGNSFGQSYFIREGKQTTNLASINLTKLAALPIPVPPVAEQHRIVAEIEKQFSRLDAGVAALKRVQANLKRYRAAVLRAACEGRLVPTEAELARAEGRDYEPADRLLERILAERRRRWEADQLAKMQAEGKTARNDTWKRDYQQPGVPVTNKLPGLPEGWVWATVEQLGAVGEQSVLTGPFGTSLGREDFIATGVPVITIGCLTDSNISLDKAVFISEEKARELERYRLRAGDLLFSRMASVGRAGIVGDRLAGALINYHIMRLRLAYRALIPGFYMAYVRGSTQVENYVREVNHGATRDGINTEQLLAMPVALPPLAEQHRIVAEVERHLSIVDEAEAIINANLKRAERLRQAILKRAFEGRLVPQDPDDEPASGLLERIRAERAVPANGKGPKGERPRAAARVRQPVLDLSEG